MVQHHSHIQYLHMATTFRKTYLVVCAILYSFSQYVYAIGEHLGNHQSIRKNQIPSPACGYNIPLCLYALHRFFGERKIYPH